MVVLSLMLTLTLTSAFASFAQSGTTHTHSWSGYTVTTQPTYVHEGVMTRTCTTCGATETMATSRIPSYSTWLYEDGKLYYSGSDGELYKGWHKMKPYKQKKVKWCYFNEEGAYTANVSKTTKNKWVKADGKKFYFSKKKKPLGPGFNFVKKKLYYMDELGAVMYGTFVASDGKKYTTAKDGSINGLAYYKNKYKKFVYIDISEQKLSLYNKGKRILYADIITGKKGVDDTPTGTFKITVRKMNVTLEGPTWSNPVTYWMAFKGNRFGMHDASWRTNKEFNNHKTYIKNGSHGCVNMRFKDAKYLYKKVKKGTPVIIVK